MSSLCRRILITHHISTRFQWTDRLKEEEGCSHCTHNDQRVVENTGLPAETLKLVWGGRSIFSCFFFYTTKLDRESYHTPLEKWKNTTYQFILMAKPVMFLRYSVKPAYCFWSTAFKTKQVADKMYSDLCDK